jgi:hypothetical protein
MPPLPSLREQLGGGVIALKRLGAAFDNTESRLDSRELLRGCNARERIRSPWCIGAKVETTGGAFQVREDELAPLVGSGLHWRL